MMACVTCERRTSDQERCPVCLPSSPPDPGAAPPRSDEPEPALARAGRDPALGDTPLTLDLHPRPAIRAGEITTASLRSELPMIDRYRVVGGAASMVVHAPPSSPLPMAAPVMLADASGPLSTIGRYSTSAVRADDITTARMRAVPSRRARAALSMITQHPAPPMSRDASVAPAPGLAPPGLASAMPVEPPEALIEVQINSLFALAKINDRDARRDSLHYWVLKVPAIVGAATASACSAFGYGSVVIILATLAAICTAVDGVRPGGILHHVHRKAATEARRAGATLRSGWHLARLESAGQLDQARSRAAGLLRAAHADRQRITDYLTAAEASLGGSTRSTWARRLGRSTHRPRARRPQVRLRSAPARS